MSQGATLVLVVGVAIVFVLVGAIAGCRTQRRRLREAQEREVNARRLADEKLSDSVNGRTLAFAIRALDAKPSERPDGIDTHAPRPHTILVEMADRFFPLPPKHDV
jgi:hypothetical protein